MTSLPVSERPKSKKLCAFFGDSKIMWKMKKEGFCSMRFGKKGDTTVTIVRAFGLALAAVIIFLLIQYWRDVKDDTFLEKSYLARDIALLISTVYASPGEVTYCYYTVGNFAGKFDYKMGKSRVIVVDHGQPFTESTTLYKYMEEKAMPLIGIEVKERDAQELAALVIKKAGDSISVEARKKGENAEPCKT